MQVRCRWSPTIAAALVLAWAVGEAPAAPPKGQDRDSARQAAPVPFDPQAASDVMAAGEAQAAEGSLASFVEVQFNRLRQALPGNEDTWFVLVMQENTSNGRALTSRRRFAIVQGRTAAAQAVTAFLTDAKRVRKGFRYRAFANPAQAQACCLALMQYSVRTGYQCSLRTGS